MALKNKFLGMIDYMDETFRDVSVNKVPGRTKRHATSHLPNVKAEEKQQLIQTLEILDKLPEGLSQPQGEGQFQPHHVEAGCGTLRMGTITEGEPHINKIDREKRNILVWAGLGWGIYSNKKQIDRIKENINKLQKQNILQDKKINELARYMNLTMEKVREHDKRIYDLEVGLVQLKNSLIELSYDFDYSVIASHLLRNAQTAVHRLMIGLTAAQHNVDRILEYLGAMATYQCSPVIISPPVLRKLLQKVEDRLTPNPRLKLPYHSKTDIWRFYDILRITPVVLDKLLVVLLTIPLTDQSLEMNIFRVHNLPLVHPEYHTSVKYKLEGEYLAIGKEGMYVALPDEDSIKICIMSDLGLCTMRNALYPSKFVEWCIYALYTENEEKIDRYCRYEFEYTDRNYARSLGGFMWVISAIVAEKLQIRCLTETHVVEIRPPIEVVYIGNGCKGYSPHLYIAARSTLTSEINVQERGYYFLAFNNKYSRDTTIGIWYKLQFKLQNRKDAMNR